MMTLAQPLAGLRVIDLTRARSGPVAARQFADWGADVIMVEKRGGQDEVTGARHGADFQNLNRNKRSLGLDLKQEEGRSVLRKMVSESDVLIENFRPDVKDRLGIDYESMRTINPRLVFGSISGFGQTGPYRDRPGLDQIAQGMGGLMSVTGTAAQGPMRAGIAVSDIASGLYCALGIMTALVARSITGKGQWVTTSLLEAQIALLDFQAVRWLVDGVQPPPAGNFHPTLAAMGLFSTADGHVNLACATQAMFIAFCHKVDATYLLNDSRFQDGASRAANCEALNLAIAEILKLKSTSHWVEVMNAIGVPCGPVNTIAQTFEDEHVKQLGIVRSVKHPSLGPLALVGQAFSLSSGEPSFIRAAPDAGEHTEEVLHEFGYKDEEISELRRRKVI